MDTAKLELINEYFDGMLDRESESFLFSTLSRDEEAREYFKKVSQIESAVNETKVEFPHVLEERIFTSIKNVKPKFTDRLLNRNFFPMFSYAAALILIIVTIFFFVQANSYQEKLNQTAVQVSQQEKLIELLYNSLPAANVKNENNEIIIKANI